MAIGRYASSDAMAVKTWSKRLYHEMLKATPIQPLIGTDKNSIIMLKTELSKGPGDQVTCAMRANLTGDGRTEGQTLEGNEEALSTFSDSMLINELHHAVRIPNGVSIDLQRVPFTLREEAKDALRDWYAKRMSVTFFNHVCGIASSASYTNDNYTVDVTDSRWNGHNTVTAPTTNRHVFATGSADETVQADSTATFDITMIDELVEIAKGAGSAIPIRPLKIDGQDRYVLYLHPYQVTSMRKSTTTGQWLDIQQSAMAGGNVSNNPIFTGALGMYNGVIIRESNDVCPGVHSSTNATQSSVRRAVFLGAQAAQIAFSSNRSPSSFKWTEELFDYKRQLGVAVSTIWGINKLVFDSEDFGSIVLSTYAAAS